jgi:serine/threonine-protein phosphatase 6 regulatory ankyrin repeat subunit B
MLAMKEGRTDLADLLLAKGAKLDIKDQEGMTALQYAIEAGQPEAVAFLANKGADLKATPYKSEAELRVATHNYGLLRAVLGHDVEAVKKFLAAGADPNFRGRDGRVALLLAVGDSQGKEIVKLLLEKNVDVNVADDLGNTPLMFAVSGNNDDIVTLLIERKAAVNARNKKQETALLQAAENGHARIVNLLLESGADFRVRNENGLTPLLVAVQAFNPQASVVELLLAKGEDANETDANGNTPLMLAARFGAFQVIEPLLNGGADVKARNKDGWTALRHAKESKETWTLQQYGEQQRAEVIKRLEQGGAKSDYL